MLEFIEVSGFVWLLNSIAARKSKVEFDLSRAFEAVRPANSSKAQPTNNLLPHPKFNKKQLSTPNFCLNWANHLERSNIQLICSRIIRAISLPCWVWLLAYQGTIDVSMEISLKA